MKWPQRVSNFSFSDYNFLSSQASSIHIFHDKWRSNSEVLHPLPFMYFPIRVPSPLPISLFCYLVWTLWLIICTLKNISTLNLLIILTFCQTNLIAFSKINQHTTLFACLCIAKEKSYHSGYSNKTNSAFPPWNVNYLLPTPQIFFKNSLRLRISVQSRLRAPANTIPVTVNHTIS